MLTRTLLGIAIGAGLGALLGSTRLCRTGACPLTASPWRAALVGGLLGLLVTAGSARGTKDASSNGSSAAPLEKREDPPPSPVDGAEEPDVPAGGGR